MKLRDVLDERATSNEVHHQVDTRLGLKGILKFCGMSQGPRSESREREVKGGFAPVMKGEPARSDMISRSLVVCSMYSCSMISFLKK